MSFDEFHERGLELRIAVNRYLLAVKDLRNSECCDDDCKCRIVDERFKEYTEAFKLFNAQVEAVQPDISLNLSRGDGEENGN